MVFRKQQLTGSNPVLSVPHSTLYYRFTKRDETIVKQAVQTTAGTWPRYGSQRVSAQMKREGVTFHDKSIGERRTRRVMREMGLLAKPRLRKVRTTNSNHAFLRFENPVKGLFVARPNQVWVSDITYIGLDSGFVYLAAIMDVFTRSIRGWFLSRRLDGDLTLLALKRALETATPEIHHSDPVGQYNATDYVSLLQNRGIAVSMASVGCSEENGYAERLMRTIKEVSYLRSIWAGTRIAERVSEPKRSAVTNWSVFDRRVPNQAHPLVAGLPDARRV